MVLNNTIIDDWRRTSLSTIKSIYLIRWPNVFRNKIIKKMKIPNRYILVIIFRICLLETDEGIYMNYTF